MLRRLKTNFNIIFLLVVILSLMVSLNEVQGDSPTITKMIDNGDTSTHIDLTIIGSGFSSGEINTYIDKVNQNISKMFTVNWFIGNQALFNIWRIDAISPVSGVDLDDSMIYSIASGTSYDILIVLHNYDGQESVAKPYVELYKSSNNYVVLAHELGHVIGKLDDEYYTPATAYKCDGLSKRTLNIHDKPSNEKWSDLIFSPPYEGARFCQTGLWRPTDNSIMRDSANSTYFDAVGLKAMDLGAGKILGTIESNPPGLQISGVQNDEVKSGILNVEAVTSDASGIERVEFYWAKAGDTSKSIKIDKTLPYDIVVDTTKYENGQYYLDTLSYDKNWNYTRLTRLFEISNSSSNLNLNIPIIIHEALTQYKPGMNRIAEPLTVGIPLAEGSGVTSISQLGLSGTILQQFRPLAYWPNGNIKWVLVDTQVDLPAGSQNTSISITQGTGTSAGELAVDSGNYIDINTGVAQFKIRKSKFNLFDSVVVNGKELVSQDSSGGLSMVGYEDTTYILNGITHTLMKDAIYDSKNDPDSTAVIEENGPLRAVVKSVGSFKDTSGNRLMDYTVRFHFYKDKSFVKTYVIMRHGQEEEHPNASGGYNQNVRIFSNMQLSIPINLGANRQFEFAANNSILSGAINGTAYMFQGYSLGHRSDVVSGDKKDSTKAWVNPPMARVVDSINNTNYIQKGLEIKNGTSVLNPLGDESCWAEGFAEIKDQDNSGLTVAMQYMSAYWPAGIEFTEQGNIEIGVFSKYNSKKDIKIGWGTHETREIMFDFHTTSVNNTGVLYRLEQPVVGRTTLDQYRTTKVIFGQDGLISAEDMDNWFLNNFGPPVYNIPKEAWSHANNGVLVWRTYWYSGVEGTDWPLSFSYTFLKNGVGGKYMSGLQKTIFNTDSAIIRTDGFDYSKSLIKSDYRYPLVETGAYNRGGGKNQFDISHNHWRAMPLYYYMTGNEEIKEAINDYMEEFVKKVISAFGFEVLRPYSRIYNTLALGYEYTKDDRLKNKLEFMTDELLDSRDNPPNLTPHGRNMERGYMWLDAGQFSNPLIHSFFLISVHVQDVWQSLRVLNAYDKDYPRTEELEDYLLGLSQFIYHEPYFDKPGGSDFGCCYDYYLHSTNQWIDGSVDGNYMRKDDSSRAMWFAYLKTGDAKYLDRGKKILAFGGGLCSSTPYPAQDLMYADLYNLNSVWNYINSVNVVNNGNNSYTLTWTVPEDAMAYQLKYSDKPIVDWLGFNQTTRQYVYSPDEYTAFFAAVNVDNEPQPAQSGSSQSFTIDIPQAINSYNTVRNLTSNNPSFIIYDPNKTYSFSMKYLTTNNPPTASVSADPGAGIAPLTVNLTGSGSDQDGTIIAYKWDFGDGGFASEQNPTYIYNNAGNYIVTLKVTDDDGAVSTASASILVDLSETNPPEPPTGLKLL